MKALTLFATLVPALSLRVPAPVTAGDALTRRGLAQSAAAVAALVAGAGGAQAAEQANRMGGLLEPYIDAPKGFKMYVPTGWNKFDADPGVYDAKWQDIINSNE